MASLARKLPPPRDYGWTFRPVESARVTRTTLDDGRRELRIDHAPLAGVTTDMLGWWFQNLDGIARYRGQSLPAYLLWHPRDHIAVAATRDATGHIGLGQIVHIQEVFGRDPRFGTEAHARIHRWDAGGIGFHVDILGHRMFELDHTFADSAEGVVYRSRAHIGTAAGLLRRPLNLGARFGFSEAKAAAWIRHNIEEVGCLEDFLPELFQDRAITR